MWDFTGSRRIRRIADRADQIILIVLFIMLCFRVLPRQFPPEHWFPIMILLSEGVVLVFILLRNQTENITLSLRDWVVALAGTMTVLLVNKGGELFMPAFGSALMMVGFFIHFGAKLSLRRSFGIVPADRGIKSNGLYRYLRHPMYFGYFISHVGFLLAAPSWWNFMVYCVAWPCLVARIFAEERILSDNPEYRAYQAKVPYRLVPMVF